MKLILKMELEGKGEEVKKALIEMLFEAMEDWVLRGQEPDFEIEE